MGNNTAGGAGTSIFTLLGVLFIGLKLANVIDWPWWVVLSPIWGSILLVIVALIVYVVLERYLRRRRRE